VPDVDSNGNLRGFLPHQVYSNTRGFPVNTQDEYEMTMVYHLNRQENLDLHGMGNYLLYVMPGPCEHAAIGTQPTGTMGSASAFGGQNNGPNSVD
jgi:hypothetical protein